MRHDDGGATVQASLLPDQSTSLPPLPSWPATARFPSLLQASSPSHHCPSPKAEEQRGGGSISATSPSAHESWHGQMCVASCPSIPFNTLPPPPPPPYSLAHHTAGAHLAPWAAAAAGSRVAVPPVTLEHAAAAVAPEGARLRGVGAPVADDRAAAVAEAVVAYRAALEAAWPSCAGGDSDEMARAAALRGLWDTDVETAPRP